MQTIKRILGLGQREKQEETRPPGVLKKFVRFIPGFRTRGGPNMPKKQSCPECGSWRKRDRKTVAGAFYNCSRDGEFFVVHRAAARANPGKVAVRAI